MDITSWKPQKVLALEYLIDNPTASQREVAGQAGVHRVLFLIGIKTPDL